MSLHALGRSRLAWLDRFIVPRDTTLAPSRWHQHIVQRRVSRLDHVRPHRLNWEALKHPEPTAEEDDEALTPRRLAGIRWSWLDGFFTTVSDNLYLGFIVLYALTYCAQDPGAHRPPHPDHPDRLDLGHRALAGRRARGLRRPRLGRL